MLASLYDPLVWLLTTGRVVGLRRATLDAAAIQPGEDVLDVGCATGSLTIAARAAGGNRARVAGVDASAPMLARARRRGARAGADIELLLGRAERLPFPDAGFDVVLISLVLHYLPADRAAQAIAEARRVLRDGGRAVVVDFRRSTGMRTRLRAHLMLHGDAAASAPDLGVLLSAGGFAEVGRRRSPLPALAIVSATRRTN